VILENFMSYEYARIPIQAGLNVICGPNGAGKSSILLGISVALGQAYTERSRRLSDLIRRGKEMARVTLLFDNRAPAGRRPVALSRSDTFALSRYLRKDGSYWYEADYHEISKAEVVELFHEVGLDPDNLLILMHQGMVEEFAITTPSEKLRMVEEAVGFAAYREHIVEARRTLEGLVTEESALVQLLENASQTLDYWKGIYERYLAKRQLLERRATLERELVWAQALKHERALQSLRERHTSKSTALEQLGQKLERTTSAAQEAQRMWQGKQTELRKLYFGLVRLEKERAAAEVRETELAAPGAVLEGAATHVMAAAERLPAAERKAAEEQHAVLHFHAERLGQKREEARRRKAVIESEVQGLQSELGSTEKEAQRAAEKYIELKISEALLTYQRKEAEGELRDVERAIREAETGLATLEPQLRTVQPRLETERSPTEVAEELRIVGSHVQTYQDVPEDAERIYTNYAGTFAELKVKLQQVAEHKHAALAEVAERNRVWRRALEELLAQVNPAYQNVLAPIGAAGLVRLTDGEDVELAGLELLVGFRGTEPVVLDAYTQSGGERSVAVMAFLLSLQQQVVSPFRAVDEFDIHLDPRNRELLFRMIFAAVRGASGQYMVITPSQLTVLEPEVHILVVQNTYGKSAVQTAREPPGASGQSRVLKTGRTEGP
jgi:chromosome segregation ATPase